MVVRADDSIRCGNYIVDSDATVDELLEKCGAPTSKDVTEEEVWEPAADGGRHTVGKTVTQVWTYDRGSRAFKIVVTIVDDKIKHIVSTP
jgi:hypothetical protein